jgi:hypothetical protein
MVLWIAITVFLVSVADDILYVFFVRRVMRGSRWSAAILSGVITAMVSWEGYWQYAHDWHYAIINAMGSSVGCPIAMYLEDRLPKGKIRDKKGQFKTVPKVVPTVKKEEVL